MFKLRCPPSAEMLGAPDNRHPDIDQGLVTAVLVLLRLGQGTASTLQGILSRHGLCQGTFFCLALLAREPGASCCASALAKDVGVSPPALTAILSRLDALGYIERRIDPEDRRRLCVSASPVGRAFLEELMPVCAAALGDYIGAVPGQELQLLHVLLGRLLSEAAQAEEAATAQ